MQTIEIRLDRALPYFLLGEFEQVLKCCQEALYFAETLGDPYWLTRTTFTLANGLWSVGDNVRAFELAQQAVTMAEALGNIPLQTGRIWPGDGYS